MANLKQGPREGSPEVDNLEATLKKFRHVRGGEVFADFSDLIDMNPNWLTMARRESRKDIGDRRLIEQSIRHLGRQNIYV
jgi:hypothetical protein